MSTPKKPTAPLKMGLRLCYLSAALGASTSNSLDNNNDNEDTGVVTLGAIQPPLAGQARTSLRGNRSPNRLARASAGAIAVGATDRDGAQATNAVPVVAGETESETLERLLRHTFGSALHSAAFDERERADGVLDVDGAGNGNGEMSGARGGEQDMTIGYVAERSTMTGGSEGDAVNVPAGGDEGGEAGEEHAPALKESQRVRETTGVYGSDTLLGNVALSAAVGVAADIRGMEHGDEKSIMPEVRVMASGLDSGHVPSSGESVGDDVIDTAVAAAEPPWRDAAETAGVDTDKNNIPTAPSVGFGENPTAVGEGYIGSTSQLLQTAGSGDDEAIPAWSVQEAAHALELGAGLISGEGREGGGSAKKLAADDGDFSDERRRATSVDSDSSARGDAAIGTDASSVSDVDLDRRSVVVGRNDNGAEVDIYRLEGEVDIAHRGTAELGAIAQKAFVRQDGDYGESETVADAGEESTNAVSPEQIQIPIDGRGVGADMQTGSVQETESPHDPEGLGDTELQAAESDADLDGGPEVSTDRPVKSDTLPTSRFDDSESADLVRDSAEERSLNVEMIPDSMTDEQAQAVSRGREYSQQDIDNLTAAPTRLDDADAVASNEEDGDSSKSPVPGKVAADDEDPSSQKAPRLWEKLGAVEEMFVEPAEDTFVQPIAGSPSEASAREEHKEGEMGNTDPDSRTPRKRPVFRFPEPARSGAAGEAGGGGGNDGGSLPASLAGLDFSLDDPGTWALPHMEDNIDSLFVPLPKGSGPDEGANSPDSIEMRLRRWGASSASRARDLSARWARTARDKGAELALIGLAMCKAKAEQMWRDVFQERAEAALQRVEDAAMSAWAAVGKHLTDPVLAEAL